MKLFNKKIEERNFNVGFVEAIFPRGIYINEDMALTIPVVAESVNKIAASIAQMPLYCYAENESGLVARKYGDYREYLLNEENSDYSLAYDYKYKIVKDLLLYGKSYSYIQKQGNKITGLHHIDYKYVTEKPYINSSNGIVEQIEIHYTLNGIPLVKDSTEFLIIKTGSKGILNSKNLFEIIQKYDEIQKKSYDNCAAPTGILQAKGRLTKDAVDRLRDSWNRTYSGGFNAGKTVVLEEGLEYKPFSFEVDKLHMSETKNALTEDILRLFGLYDNTNDYDKYLKMVLSGYINAIECGINKALLLEKDKKNGLFFRFNTSELLRPNTAQQFEMYSLAVKSGLMTLEECRAALDMERFFDDETSDKLIMSLGNVFLSPDGSISIPNMGLQMQDDGTVINTSADQSGGVSNETGED